MNLWKYDGKIINLTDTEGQTFIGFADYHDAEDNASGISSLSIILESDEDGIALEFEESEIVGIEIVSSGTPVMANVV